MQPNAFYLLTGSQDALRFLQLVYLSSASLFLKSRWSRVRCWINFFVFRRRCEPFCSGKVYTERLWGETRTTCPRHDDDTCIPYILYMCMELYICTLAVRSLSEFVCSLIDFVEPEVAVDRNGFASAYGTTVNLCTCTMYTTLPVSPANLPSISVIEPMFPIENCSCSTCRGDACYQSRTASLRYGAPGYSRNTGPSWQDSCGLPHSPSCLPPLTFSPPWRHVELSHISTRQLLIAAAVALVVCGTVTSAAKCYPKTSAPAATTAHFRLP